MTPSLTQAGSLSPSILPSFFASVREKRPASLVNHLEYYIQVSITALLHLSSMAISRLFRQNNGSAVVFLGVGIVPLLVVLGFILAQPHSALAAPCDPQVSGYGPTTS